VDPPSTENPKALGSWDMKTITAMPLRYPIRMGLDRSSVITPTRRYPAAMHTRPAMMLRADASATAVAGSPAASGRITTAITGAREESGPRTSCLLGPNTEYAIRAAIVV